MRVRDFVKRVQAGRDFYPEFFFHVLHGASGKLCYHVSTRDLRGKNIFFTMRKNSDGAWKIIDAPKVPDWIFFFETKLAEAIVENSKA